MGWFGGTECTGGWFEGGAAGTDIWLECGVDWMGSWFCGTDWMGWFGGTEYRGSWFEGGLDFTGSSLCCRALNCTAHSWLCWGHCAEGNTEGNWLSCGVVCTEGSWLIFGDDAPTKESWLFCEVVDSLLLEGKFVWNAGKLFSISMPSRIADASSAFLAKPFFDCLLPSFEVGSFFFCFFFGESVSSWCRLSVITAVCLRGRFDFEPLFGNCSGTLRGLKTCRGNEMLQSWSRLSFGAFLSFNNIRIFLSTRSAYSSNAFFWSEKCNNRKLTFKLPVYSFNRNLIGVIFENLFNLPHFGSCFFSWSRETGWIITNYGHYSHTK